MERDGLWLGHAEGSTDEPFSLDPALFAKHVGIFGSTGSGKTVLGKIMIEEMARHGIPSIVIDPQGDIASMALQNEASSLADHGIDAGVAADFFSRTNVRVFTPSSNKGLQISLNPVLFPPFDMDEIEVVRILDNVSSTLVELLVKLVKYPTSKAMQSKSVIYSILLDSWKRQQVIDDVYRLARVVEVDDSIHASFMNKGDKDKLVLSFNNLLVGSTGLLFTGKTRLNIGDILSQEGGRVPVNIFFLKTLLNENEKHLFISVLLQSLYAWMIQQGSSPTLNCFFYMDEVAPFLPAGMSSPPGKEMLLLLLRQARKYGISCGIATQSPKDIDYHGLDQINTLFFGRIISQQSQKVIRSLLAAKLDDNEADRLLNEIGSLETAHFISIVPDIKGLSPIMNFKARYLFTKHVTLTETDVKNLNQQQDAEDISIVDEVTGLEASLETGDNIQEEVHLESINNERDFETFKDAFCFGELNEKMLIDIVSRTVEYEYHWLFKHGIHVQKSIPLKTPVSRVFPALDHLLRKTGFEMVDITVSENGLPLMVHRHDLGSIITCAMITRNNPGVLGLFCGVEDERRRKEGIIVVDGMLQVLRKIMS